MFALHDLGGYVAHGQSSLQAAQKEYGLITGIPVPADKRLQRTVIERVPSHMRHPTVAEPEALGCIPYGRRA